MAMASFQYPKLDHHASTVRLLTINRDNGRKISGKLYRVSLDKQPSFVAISYLWGNSTADTEITLNGKPFMVRSNVERLLHEMRDHPKLKWRFFWIDSICINQHNFDERNHQVKLMKQIYTKAAEVVIWLGPETAQTDVAMDWISRQDEEPQQVKVSDGFLGHRNQDASRCFWQDQEGKAILDFFQQKYWERVWVIQEIMNARNIRVCCGAKSFPWRNLENVLSHLIAIRMLSWFGRYRYALEVLHSRAAIVVEEKRRWELRTGFEKDGLPLSILIPRYSHLESTNRLDKVYGLLGISSDEILVDYHQSPRQVFCEVLVYVCTTQLTARHTMESFETTLLETLAIDRGTPGLVTVEDIMYRIPKVEEINPEHKRPIRSLQPADGSSEREEVSIPPLYHDDFRLTSEAQRLKLERSVIETVDCRGRLVQDLTVFRSTGAIIPETTFQRAFASREATSEEQAAPHLNVPIAKPRSRCDCRLKRIIHIRAIDLLPISLLRLEIGKESSESTILARGDLFETDHMRRSGYWKYVVTDTGYQRQRRLVQISKPFIDENRYWRQNYRQERRGGFLRGCAKWEDVLLMANGDKETEFALMWQRYPVRTPAIIAALRATDPPIWTR